MALKILVADPSLDWLTQAKNFLQEKGYEVVTAANGKDAQLSIYNSHAEKKPFFYVVLNMELQNHSGPQVMKFIKSKHPGQLVLITLEDETLIKDGSLGPEQLQRLGAIDVMPKPMGLDDLLSRLEGQQTMGQLVANIKKSDSVSEEVDVDMSDESFSQIPIGEFYANRTVLFDVYVKLAANKYLKILHSGDTFSPERIAKYRDEKKVTHLYFHSRDRKKYIKFCNFLAAKVIQKNLAGSTQMKVNILKVSAEKFLEEVSTEGLRPQSIDQGKEICENVFNMVESDQELYKILKEFNEFDPSMFTHAYLVCLFSGMIVKQFDWQSKATIETIAMAALFHDIGKIKLPKEIARLKAPEMTPEQLAIYKEHPEIGAGIIDGNKMITNSVKQVILQHHEYSDGSGFPSQLKDPKILTLSKILILANYFADYIVENEVTPIVALKKVLSNPDTVKKFNGSVLEKFMLVFVDPAKKKKDTQLQSNSKVVAKKAS